MNLHGAHGYLLHAFMTEESKRRTDRYGGTFANRIRLPLEVFKACRAAWPADKPIMMRLSMADHGWPPEDSVRLVRELKALEIDIIDCSSGGLKGSPVPPGTTLSLGYQVPLAALIRQKTGPPTAAAGLIVNAGQAENILARGVADLVAQGRELMLNPNWPINTRQKLGGDAEFSAATTPARFWLAKRAAAVPGLQPSAARRARPADSSRTTKPPRPWNFSPTRIKASHSCAIATPIGKDM